MSGAFALNETVSMPAPYYSSGGVTLFRADGHMRPLEEIEADVIRLAIGHYRGRMTEVARRLGIGRSTLYRKLLRYGVGQDEMEDGEEAPEASQDAEPSEADRVLHAVDEASLTGEPMPMLKRPGDPVRSGSRVRRSRTGPRRGN